MGLFVIYFFWFLVLTLTVQSVEMFRCSRRKLGDEAVRSFITKSRLCAGLLTIGRSDELELARSVENSRYWALSVLQGH